MIMNDLSPNRNVFIFYIGVYYYRGEGSERSGSQFFTVITLYLLITL